MKRYSVEPWSDLVRSVMAEAGAWIACRIGYIEIVRALAIKHGAGRAIDRFAAEWKSMTIVEVDRRLVESAAVIAVEERLRTLDSLHLAAALLWHRSDLVLATWDRRLWEAARRRGFDVLPARI